MSVSGIAAVVCLQMRAVDGISAAAESGKSVCNGSSRAPWHAALR